MPAGGLHVLPDDVVAEVELAVVLDDEEARLSDGHREMAQVQLLARCYRVPARGKAHKVLLSSKSIATVAQDHSKRLC